MAGSVGVNRRAVEHKLKLKLKLKATIRLGDFARVRKKTTIPIDNGKMLRVAVIWVQIMVKIQLHIAAQRPHIVNGFHFFFRSL